MYSSCLTLHCRQKKLVRNQSFASHGAKNLQCLSTSFPRCPSLCRVKSVASAAASSRKKNRSVRALKPKYRSRCSTLHSTPALILQKIENNVLNYLPLSPRSGLLFTNQKIFCQFSPACSKLQIGSKSWANRSWSSCSSNLGEKQPSSGRLYWLQIVAVDCEPFHSDVYSSWQMLVQPFRGSL